AFGRNDAARNPKSETTRSPNDKMRKTRTDRSSSFTCLTAHEKTDQPSHSHRRPCPPLDRRLRSRPFRLEIDERELRSSHPRHVEGAGGNHSRAADHRGNERFRGLQENHLPLRRRKEVRPNHLQERRGGQQG